MFLWQGCESRDGNFVLSLCAPTPSTASANLCLHKEARGPEATSSCTEAYCMVLRPMANEHHNSPDCTH